MEIPQYIIDEAQQALQSGILLPFQLPSAPEFYLSCADDPIVTAIHGFVYEENEYKIGVHK
jgi:hypothetical protein